MNPSDRYLSIDEARRLYAAGDVAHDFDHVLRVTGLAIRLAKAEDADPELTRLAALLHDVPVANAGGRLTHHLAAAAHAGALLSKRGLGTDDVANVVHCIEAHRFRDQSIQPETLEAKCLYDADKLDSMGAIGVARAYAFAGARGSRLWVTPWTDVPQDGHAPRGRDYTPVHEYIYKLDRLLATLHTAMGRRLGAERHAFMRSFYTQLDREMSESAWP